MNREEELMFQLQKLDVDYAHFPLQGQDALVHLDGNFNIQQLEIIIEILKNREINKDILNNIRKTIEFLQEIKPFLCDDLIEHCDIIRNELTLLLPRCERIE